VEIRDTRFRGQVGLLLVSAASLWGRMLIMAIPDNGL